jgi:hypothetical protein
MNNNNTALVVHKNSNGAERVYQKMMVKTWVLVDRSPGTEEPSCGKHHRPKSLALIESTAINPMNCQCQTKT